MLYFLGEICHGCDDRKIPLLKEVFDEFPNTPINLDIKTYNEELIVLVSITYCTQRAKLLLILLLSI